MRLFVIASQQKTRIFIARISPCGQPTRMRVKNSP